jgi:hypothetical protein
MVAPEQAAVLLDVDRHQDVLAIDTSFALAVSAWLEGAPCFGGSIRSALWECLRLVDGATCMGVLFGGLEPRWLDG